LDFGGLVFVGWDLFGLVMTDFGGATAGAVVDTPLGPEVVAGVAVGPAVGAGGFGASTTAV
jgi:hypothetical protein